MNGKTNGVYKNGKEKEEVLEKEEEEARVKIWKYVFGFTEMAVIKCAIDLGIPDLLEKNGGSMSLLELSTTLKCPTNTLYRIMRFLTHQKIFNQTFTSKNDDEIKSIVYTQTALSRKLILNNNSTSNTSMAALILLESSPAMLAPWLGLSDRVRDKSRSAFDDANGEDVWKYASNNPCHSKLISDAMACDARLVVPSIVKDCHDLFVGVSTLVDVGGADGTSLSMLVKAFPWLHGINFDLPHVVSKSTIVDDRIQHVGGDMFDCIPKADAVFIMWVLHDWGDDECIQILKKCKEAIPSNKGKVIIVEAVVEDEATNVSGEDELEDVRLTLDMVMMAHTTYGKERTLNEWKHVLNQAGFSHFNVYPIQAVQSVIEAYP